MSDTFAPQPYPLWATWEAAPGSWHVGLVLGWSVADNGTAFPLVRGLWDLTAAPVAVEVYALALSVEAAQAMADEIAGAQHSRNRSATTTP